MHRAIRPVLHFLLKNGASLGSYLLLREDMNWPFDSEEPLTIESFKLGAAITFQGRVAARPSTRI